MEELNGKQNHSGRKSSYKMKGANSITQNIRAKQHQNVCGFVRKKEYE